MKTLSFALTGLGLALSCILPSVAAATRLEAQLVDDATGQPMAARVAVTNEFGQFVEIEGKHSHVQYLAKR